MAFAILKRLYFEDVSYFKAKLLNSSFTKSGTFSQNIGDCILLILSLFSFKLSIDISLFSLLNVIVFNLTISYTSNGILFPNNPLLFLPSIILLELTNSKISST
ncbi:hypothetical protein N5S72_10590 [Aliarcobacter cryaerophilus]|uniref:hypothetical protein n=1 Tax=Aliarcobacter cryaerophilus TaxID=28198 RepID=UPI0021B47654|nr:hypothetical protein [Aliarcobacter cryaerophilus]MCT7464895.1 hypothetical protein [Aliarcobacter cryaerophilus]